MFQGPPPEPEGGWWECTGRKKRGCSAPSGSADLIPTGKERELYSSASPGLAAFVRSRVPPQFWLHPCSLSGSRRPLAYPHHVPGSAWGPPAVLRVCEPQSRSFAATSWSHGESPPPLGALALNSGPGGGVSSGASDAVPLSPCAGELAEGANPAPAHSAVTGVPM